MHGYTFASSKPAFTIVSTLQYRVILNRVITMDARPYFYPFHMLTLVPKSGFKGTDK